MAGCTYYLIGMKQFTVIGKVLEDVLEKKSNQT